MSEKAEVQKFVFKSFLRRLDWFLDKPVDIEFFCGDCCKETEFGELRLVGKDFVELIGKCDSIIIKAFLPGVGEVDVQKAKRIIIPAKRICSAEIPKCDYYGSEEEDFEIEDIPLESLKQRIECFWQDKIVAVEFECGDCCKKAEFGKLRFVGIDFIELTRVDKIPLKVIVFLAGVGKVKEIKVDRIIIPLDNVCSIQTVQKDCID